MCVRRANTNKQQQVAGQRTAWASLAVRLAPRLASSTRACCCFVVISTQNPSRNGNISRRRACRVLGVRKKCRVPSSGRNLSDRLPAGLVVVQASARVDVAALEDSTRR